MMETRTIYHTLQSCHCDSRALRQRRTGRAEFEPPVM